MTKVLFWAAMLLLSASAVQAADICKAQYEPFSGRFLASADEAQGVRLSESEQSTAQTAWKDYGEKADALFVEFQFLRDSVLEDLKALPVSRNGIDAAMDKMLKTLDEQVRLNVDWQLFIDRNIPVGHRAFLERAHQKARRGQPRLLCGPREGRLKIPMLRYDLNDHGKALIGLTEEEGGYLQQFYKSNAILRAEYNSLSSQLDQELSRRQPDAGKIDMLLSQLALNTRQDTTNAIDCYFYAEANLFTPERMGKLKKDLDRRKKRK